MVAVVMTTYDPGNTPRYDYASQCLWSLNYHLRSDEPIRFILADDGSLDVDPLARYVAQFRAHNQTPVEIVTGQHGGIGASLNRALDGVGRENLWMYTTDDWDLQDILDLNKAAWLIRERGYDLVRLGPMHPNVVCTATFEFPQGWWWDINVQSNQFACATRPFLAGPGLMHKIVSFLERSDSYGTEIAFGYDCQRAGVRAASIHLDGPWEHIGDYEVGRLPI